MTMNLMTALVKKVFISSKPTFVYLLCPPLCGPFSIQESAAGGLSYKVKKNPAKQDSPPAAGRASDILPFRCSAIRAERFLSYGNEVSYTIKKPPRDTFCQRSGFFLFKNCILFCRRRSAIFQAFLSPSSPAALLPGAAVMPSGMLLLTLPSDSRSEIPVLPIQKTASRFLQALPSTVGSCSSQYAL